MSRLAPTFLAIWTGDWADGLYPRASHGGGTGLRVPGAPDMPQAGIVSASRAGNQVRYEVVSPLARQVAEAVLAEAGRVPSGP